MSTSSEAPGSGVPQMRSPAIMLGSHDRPDVRLPVTADGFYDTGNVFRMDADGFDDFVGRTDDMVVSGGENIFPSEVDLVPERHPDIRQVCVVPVKDAIKGNSPVAFVVRRPGTSSDAEAIKRHVLAKAPAYQHPRRVWFPEPLPLASTNEVDRTGLRASFRRRCCPADETSSAVRRRKSFFDRTMSTDPVQACFLATRDTAEVTDTVAEHFTVGMPRCHAYFAEFNACDFASMCRQSAT